MFAMTDLTNTIVNFLPLCNHTVFSGLSTFVCPYGFPWIVHPCVPMRFSLDWPFFFAPTVFSGFSALVCPYGFLWVVCPSVPLRVSLDCPPLCVPTYNCQSLE
jgi:hypothetical protein